MFELPRHLFHDEVVEWAEARGALVKSVEDAALGMASVYRALEMPLPREMRYADDAVLRKFADLLARFMPLDLVIDEQTADGGDVRVSKTSVCGTWGAIAGTLRYFADRSGVPRAAIEGTQVAFDLVKKYATQGDAELVLDWHRKRDPLLVRRRLDYFGFELGRRAGIDRRVPAGVRGGGAARARGVARARGGAARRGEAEPRRDRRGARTLAAERRRDAAARHGGPHGDVRGAARGRELAGGIPRGRPHARSRVAG